MHMVLPGGHIYLLGSLSIFRIGGMTQHPEVEPKVKEKTSWAFSLSTQTPHPPRVPVQQPHSTRPPGGP